MKFLNIIQLEGFLIDPRRCMEFSSIFPLLIKTKQKKKQFTHQKTLCVSLAT